MAKPLLTSEQWKFLEVLETEAIAAGLELKVNVRFQDLFPLDEDRLVAEILKGKQLSTDMRWIARRLLWWQPRCMVALCWSHSASLIKGARIKGARLDFPDRTRLGLRAVAELTCA